MELTIFKRAMLIWCLIGSASVSVLAHPATLDTQLKVREVQNNNQDQDQDQDPDPGQGQGQLPQETVTLRVRSVNAVGYPRGVRALRGGLSFSEQRLAFWMVPNLVFGLPLQEREQVGLGALLTRAPNPPPCPRSGPLPQVNPGLFGLGLRQNLYLHIDVQNALDYALSGVSEEHQDDTLVLPTARTIPELIQESLVGGTLQGSFIFERFSPDDPNLVVAQTIITYYIGVLQNVCDIDDQGATNVNNQGRPPPPGGGANAGCTGCNPFTVIFRGGSRG